MLQPAALYTALTVTKFLPPPWHSLVCTSGNQYKLFQHTPRWRGLYDQPVTSKRSVAWMHNVCPVSYCLLTAG